MQFIDLYARVVRNILVKHPKYSKLVYSNTGSEKIAGSINTQPGVKNFKNH